MKRVLFLLNTMLTDSDRALILSDLDTAGIMTEFVLFPLYKDKICFGDDELIVTDCPDVVTLLKKQGGDALILLHDDTEIGRFPNGKYFVIDPQECGARYFINIYKRIHNEPWEIARTKRLTIRETTESDIDIFYRLYDDPLMKAYMEPLYPDSVKEKEYAAEYRERVYSVQEFGIWTLIETESGDIIGRGGLNFRSGFDNVEIGFAIGANYRGKGYAKEAIRYFLSFAKEREFHRVNAFVVPENTPSKNLLFSLGFKYVETVTAEGKVYDVLSCEN